MKEAVEPTRVFAYGMNVNPSYMDGATDPVPAVLRGWRLRLCGYADVQPGARDEVAGVLWTVSPRMLALLDVREHHPTLYRRVEVEVDGERAWVYSLWPDEHATAPPSYRYLQVVRDGYRHFGLDEARLDEALAEVGVMTEMTPRNEPDRSTAANLDESGLRLALARLREGTEVLRTGGGTTLTAEQCGLLLDFIDAVLEERHV